MSTTQISPYKSQNRHKKKSQKRNQNANNQEPNEAHHNKPYKRNENQYKRAIRNFGERRRGHEENAAKSKPSHPSCITKQRLTKPLKKYGLYMHGKRSSFLQRAPELSRVNQARLNDQLHQIINLANGEEESRINLHNSSTEIGAKERSYDYDQSDMIDDPEPVTAFSPDACVNISSEKFENSAAGNQFQFSPKITSTVRNHTMSNAECHFKYDSPKHLKKPKSKGKVVPVVLKNSTTKSTPVDKGHKNHINKRQFDYSLASVKSSESVSDGEDSPILDYNDFALIVIETATPALIASFSDVDIMKETKSSLQKIYKESCEKTILKKINENQKKNLTKSRTPVVSNIVPVEQQFVAEADDNTPENFSPAPGGYNTPPRASQKSTVILPVAPKRTRATISYGYLPDSYYGVSEESACHQPMNNTNADSPDNLDFEYESLLESPQKNLERLFCDQNRHKTYTEMASAKQKNVFMVNDGTKHIHRSYNPYVLNNSQNTQDHNLRHECQSIQSHSSRDQGTLTYSSKECPQFSESMIPVRSGIINSLTHHDIQSIPPGMQPDLNKLKRVSWASAGPGTNLEDELHNPQDPVPGHSHSSYVRAAASKLDPCTSGYRKPKSVMNVSSSPFVPLSHQFVPETPTIKYYRHKMY